MSSTVNHQVQFEARQLERRSRTWLLLAPTPFAPRCYVRLGAGVALVLVGALPRLYRLLCVPAPPAASPIASPARASPPPVEVVTGGYPTGGYPRVREAGMDGGGAAAEFTPMKWQGSLSRTQPVGSGASSGGGSRGAGYPQNLQGQFEAEAAARTQRRGLFGTSLFSSMSSMTTRPGPRDAAPPQSPTPVLRANPLDPQFTPARWGETRRQLEEKKEARSKHSAKELSRVAQQRSPPARRPPVQTSVAAARSAAPLPRRPPDGPPSADDVPTIHGLTPRNGPADAGGAELPTIPVVTPRAGEGRDSKDASPSASRPAWMRTLRGM